MHNLVEGSAVTDQKPLGETGSFFMERQHDFIREEMASQADDMRSETAAPLQQSKMSFSRQDFTAAQGMPPNQHLMPPAMTGVYDQSVISGV